MNRREFLRKTAATGLMAGVAGVVSAEAQSQKQVGDRIPIPDDGWRLWVDREAAWKDDAIYLPEDVDLAKLRANPPTGGWEMVEKLAGSVEWSKQVTLPSTVEQHFWGKFGERAYLPGEYVYQRTDSVPRNGAYFGVSWWSREIDIPAAGGAFTYEGQVGDFRAPWMGNRYFIRQHPTYAGLPQDQAMSIYFQADGSLSNGLLMDGPGVDIFVAYSRDHDRQIGAGTFSAKYGKGNCYFNGFRVCIHCCSRGGL